MQLRGEAAGQIEDLEEQLYKLQQKVEQYPEALQIARQILAFRKDAGQPDDHWQVCDSRRLVTHLEHFRDLPEETQAAIARAYKLHEDGIAHTQSGSFNMAVEPLRDALEIRRATVGDDHIDTIDTFLTLAHSWDELGYRLAAERLNREALGIAERVLGDDHPTVGLACNNLAVNQRRSGKLKEAEIVCERSLKIRNLTLGGENLTTINTLSNLAAIYSQQDELLPKAQELFEQSREALSKMPVSNRQQFYLAAATNNLGHVLDRQGGAVRHQRAKDLFDQAFNIYSDIGHSNWLMAANNKAMNGVLRKSYDDAERDLQSLVDESVLVNGDPHPITVVLRTNLALIQVSMGKASDAEENARLAAASFEVARLNANTSGVERPSSVASGVSPNAVLSISRLSQNDFIGAWTAWESSLGRGLLDDVSARTLRHVPIEIANDEVRLLDTISSENKKIEGLRKKGKTITEATAYRDRIYAELSKTQSDFVDGNGALEGQVFDLTRIQNCLDNDDAIIGWLDVVDDFHGSIINAHWACAIRKVGNPHWIRLSGSGPDGRWISEDEELPLQFRRLLKSPSTTSPDEWRQLAKKLSDQRLAPLMPFLDGNSNQPPVRQLIVLPSKAMDGVPVFAMTDRFVATRAPSATLFAWLTQRSRSRLSAGLRSGRLLLIGNPTYIGTEWPKMKWAPFETAVVSALFDPAKKLILEESSANEIEIERLVDNGAIGDYELIHLSAHGQADREVGMHSFIVLTQSNSEDSVSQLVSKKRLTGELTAEQIFQTWKLNASLVTLSACESGLGSRKFGEGFIGFSYALHAAGADTVLVSQWRVDDKATALLMKRFYENLVGKRPELKGTPMRKTEALQEARIWLRSLKPNEINDLIEGFGYVPAGGVAGEPEQVLEKPFDHPYYWASFELFGSTE